MMEGRAGLPGVGVGVLREFVLLGEPDQALDLARVLEEGRGDEPGHDQPGELARLALVPQVDPGLEQDLPPGVGRGVRRREHQRPDRFRVPQREFLGDQAPHRLADDECRTDTERLEHPGGVNGEVGRRVWIRRPIAPADVSVVEPEDPEPLREMPTRDREGPVVAAQARQEHERRSLLPPLNVNVKVPAIK